MKDFELRYERGLIFMPENLAEEAGFETPYEYKAPEVAFDMTATEYSIEESNTAADRASQADDPAEWARLQNRVARLRLRNSVFSAMTELIIDRAVDSFDDSFNYYFGENGAHADLTKISIR